MNDDRRAKLEQLKADKALKSTVVFSDGESLAKSLQLQFNKFKETIDGGVDLNADELLEKFGKIEALKEAVDELTTSIDCIVIPEMPESVKINGLESLMKAIQVIADKEITIEKVDMTPLNRVSEQMDVLIQNIEALKVPPQGQKPEDYIPTRRVMKVGKTLMYDDSFYTGGGGGGAGPIGLLPLEFDDLQFSNADANGNYQVGTLRLSGSTVATLALTYDDNSNLTRITRTSV